MINLGEKVSEEEIEEMIQELREAQIDELGNIDYEAFVKIMMGEGG